MILKIVKGLCLYVLMLVSGIFLLNFTNDYTSFHRFIQDKHFSKSSWYEENIFSYPYTLYMLKDAEYTFSVSRNASNTEIWFVKDVCLGEKCFWTIINREEVK